MKDVKKTLALAIVVSAACFVFVAVLYRNHQRFTPAIDTVRMALDTHTGMLCLEDGAANAHGAASGCVIPSLSRSGMTRIREKWLRKRRLHDVFGCGSSDESGMVQQSKRTSAS
jgi:hypothetical protein